MLVIAGDVEGAPEMKAASAGATFLRNLEEISTKQFRPSTDICLTMSSGFGDSVFVVNIGVLAQGHQQKGGGGDGGVLGKVPGFRPASSTDIYRFQNL